MTTLKQLFKGYKIGTPQVAGLMRVIPILTKTEFTAVASMEKIYVDKDMDYDTLRMTNESDSIGVIPHGLMYVISEKAQDRVVPSAHLIKGKKEINVNCLQPSEGGYMAEGQQDREWGILPANLKISAWQHAHEKRYDALWGDMQTFLRDVGLSGRELIQFFREFKTELEEFVAQFEPVKNQVGAFFIMNNVLIGIEIVPNYAIWQQMWRPLVRDCYGSEAIHLIKKGHAQAIFKPVLQIDKIDTFADLENQVDDLLKADADLSKDIIKDIQGEEVMAEQEQELDNFTLYKMQSDSFLGQFAKHGPERIIYLSAVLREAQKASEPRRQFNSLWNENSPYRQDESFEL